MPKTETPRQARSRISAGLSTSATQPTVVNAPRVSLSTLTSSRSTGIPTQQIASSRQIQGINRLQLPEDLPPYYTRIGIASYTRENWLRIGNLTTTSSIFLPMPFTMQDTQGVSWKETPLDFAGGIGSTAIYGGNNGTSLTGLTGEALAGMAYKGARAGLDQGATKGIVEASLMASGAAVNQFMVLMLEGPAFKKHKLKWKFSPRNERESITLINLYTTIMDAQAPSLANAGSAFWRYPKIFSIEYVHDDVDLGQRLHRFKKCILEAAIWDFTPMNTPAFFARSKSPESVEVELQFTELEYWIAGDYAAGGYSEYTGGNSLLVDGIVAGFDRMRTWWSGAQAANDGSS